MPPLPRWDAGSLVLVALSFVAGVLATWLIRRGRRGNNGHQQERRGPFALRLAAVAAAVCTGYSADTSWRFAGHYLGMYSTAERIAMFAAGELALFATALLARQNLHSAKRAPGLPGVLVWVITAVQIIPAYAESGLVGGTVRAFLGPVMAAVLWHLAMGIELRHRISQAASNSLVARIGREVRERLLSRLGIADRSRDAQQIARDRAITKAVALAARLAEKPKAHRVTWRGRRIMRRLSDAIDRAQVATDPQQHEQLVARFAARRHAAALLDADLNSPWARSTHQRTAIEPSALRTSGTGPRSHDRRHPSRAGEPEVATPRSRRNKTAALPKPGPSSAVPEQGVPEPKPGRTGRPPNMSVDELLALARDIVDRTGTVSHNAIRAELRKLERKAANTRIAQILDTVKVETGVPEAVGGSGG
ncbi:hypothetical protein [Streptomyces adelaidensis]|uniref:hypothetical protein n=1 Tax=Streptomyces adelaidensis TaxID=2796465 RepID=UPI0019039F34|nr:hypothetical protein [Streptomyces adelaidensis]